MDLILNDETKKYIQLGDDDIVKKLPNVLKRVNPHCSCDDPYCPHKAPVSPLAIWASNQMMLGTIKLKDNFEQNFDPNVYGIKRITHFQEICDSFFGIYGPENKSFYSRYEIPITVDSNKYKVSFGPDIVEGFVFDPIDHIESITFDTNGSRQEFKLIDNTFLPKYFFFPMRSGLQFANLTLIINKVVSQPITFRMICGNLPYIQHQFVEYFTKMHKMKFQYGDRTFGFNIGAGTGFFDIRY